MPSSSSIARPAETAVGFDNTESGWLTFVPSAAVFAGAGTLNDTLRAWYGSGLPWWAWRVEKLAALQSYAHDGLDWYALVPDASTQTPRSLFDCQRGEVADTLAGFHTAAERRAMIEHCSRLLPSPKSDLSISKMSSGSC